MRGFHLANAPQNQTTKIAQLNALSLLLVSGSLHGMAIQTGKSLQAANYTNAFRAVLPGLLIGIMFLAVSFASKSAAHSEQRAIERTLAAKIPVPEDLRQDILLDVSSRKNASSRVSVLATTEAGLRRLNNPEEAAPLERVTIEIDIAPTNTSDHSKPQIPVELLEVLSRRASALQFQMTLRVNPGNKRTALHWFDTIRKSAEPEQIVDISEMAVSLVDSMPLDKLQIHILRAKKMVAMQESQP